MTLDITLPDPEMVPVTLKPRRVLHGRAGLQPLEHRLLLAVPFVQRLRPDALHIPHAEAPPPDETHVDYHFLSLVINCYPDSDAPLVSIDVGLLLTHDGPADLPPPTAWRVDPTRVTTPGKVSTKVSLTGNLGFLKTETAQTADGDEEVFLLGLGEGQNNPEWRFRATTSQPEITGIHRLSVVVRSPDNVRSGAAVIVAAAVRRRRAGLLRYRADLPTSMQEVRFPSS